MPLIYKAVPGWLDYENIYRAAVARATSGELFVELGCLYGRSACFMASEIRSSGKKIRFDAVDRWTIKVGKFPKGQPTPPAVEKICAAGGGMFEVFNYYVGACGFSDIINPIRAVSPDAASLYHGESIDFLWIDADHTAPAVAADLKAWWPKIKLGGIMAGHDFHCFEGVRLSVNRFFGEAEDSRRFYVKPQSWAVVKEPGLGDEFRATL